MQKNVYIIGYSLRLPESNHVLQLHENLINKVNMMTCDDRRWPPGYNETPKYLGKIKQSLDYFDNVFFGVHGKQAEKLDPQLRLLLETSFEALIDAAIFPQEIKGSDTGVYIGSCFSDAFRLWLADKEKMTGYEMPGCAQSMYANRLSYFYDIHGPSYNLDSACSSSLMALHLAVNDLRSKNCELALVGGTSILLDSHTSYGFNQIKMNSPDGFCKTFDKSANGYGRSEGVVILLLTTNKKWLRYTPYAKVLATAVNTCGYNEKGITFPNAYWQSELYKDIFNQSTISSDTVHYIECHGTGTIAGDSEEISGIKNFFGQREDMVLGAFKTNIGHPEGAAGIASVCKVLLSFENRLLYPQLHLKNRIPIADPMKTVTELEQWSEDKAIINSFGFGGANACVLLEKTIQEHESEIVEPWHGLYFISARTKAHLYQLKRALEKHPQQIPVWKDPRYPWREVIGLPDVKVPEPIIPRPIYFVFSGNGSQWNGMGKALLQGSPIFKRTMQACGNDITELIENGTKNSLEATRLLTAIQIGLVELLKSIGIVAEGYIGHSAGETGAGYASGTLSINETMRFAYARGKASNHIPKGAMISVGLNHQQVLPWIKEVDQVSIACINSPRNVSLSGSKAQIEALYQRFIEANIFVRHIHNYNIPYHSLFIDRAKSETYFKKAYQGYISRNLKWISAIKGYQPEIFTADYFVESFCRPVDFLNAMQNVPDNAIVVEIGPHHALRSLVYDCVPSVKYISLMQKDIDDYVSFKNAIAYLWSLGANISIQPDDVRPSLQVRVEQVGWQREYFPVPLDRFAERIYKKNIELDITGNDQYLLGHVIDNRPILPAMAYIVIMWESFLQNHPTCKIVAIDNFKILRSVHLIGSKIKLDLFMPASNRYELLYNDEIVATATLSIKTLSCNKSANPSFTTKHSISKKTFYRLCHNDGYNYTNAFQVINEVFITDEMSHLYAKISSDNWISFLDGMLQLSLLKKSCTGFRLPTAIRHIELSKSKSDIVVLNTYLNTINCGEIKIEGLETSPAIRQKKHESIVFKKEELFLLGHNTTDHERSNYLLMLLYFGAHKFNSIQNKLTDPHHSKVKHILKQYCKDVDETQFAKIKNPYIYHLINEVYSDFDNFIASPIKRISQSDHYSGIYYDDYINDIQFLEKCLSVVRENFDREITIFEIGTGTGGFIKQVSEYLKPGDKIHCSDIAGNRIIHNDNTLGLTIDYTHYDLNEPMSNQVIERLSKADVIVASNALHATKHIENSLHELHKQMKPGAFLLLIEATSPFLLPLFGMDVITWNFLDKRDFGLWLSFDQWTIAFKNAKFNLISYLTDENDIAAVFFCRKPYYQVYQLVEKPKIKFDDTWSEPIKNSKGPFLFYSESPEGLAGFARTLTLEGKRSIMLCAPTLDTFRKQVEEYDLVTNYINDGQHYTLCYIDTSANNDAFVNKPFHLEFPEIGHLDNTAFVLSKQNRGKLCQVHYAALNFRDVMIASGKVSKDSYLGFSKDSAGVGIEFSGTCGTKRVMGIALDAIANAVYSDFYWDIPENMTLAEAATIPIAYLTIYYALIQRVNIKANQSILIHGGTGAVGQAAIRICLDLGCKIFTTCHQSKRGYLKKLFPELDDSNIGDSRTIQFEELVMMKTQGKGVQIVLNSLADDKLQASLRCLAQHGIFVEIGKYDIMANTLIGMKHLLRNTTFCGIDIDQVLETNVMEKLSVHLQDGLCRGVVKPLDYTIFKADQITDAFRFLGTGKQLGKVLIEMKNYFPQKVINRFCTHGTHIIVGGLGGFGMELANWLTERGAANIVLISRSGVKNGEQLLFLQKIKEKIPVHVIIADLTQWNEAKNLISKLPNIVGIYNLALALNDTYFEGMTREKWDDTVLCKALITKHLDQLTRDKNVEQFVCFSSYASQGNTGQSNYAYANQYMESICRERKQAGFRAHAIQWGAIDNIGFVSEQSNEFIRRLNDTFNIALQSKESCFNYLEKSLFKEGGIYLIYREKDQEPNTAINVNKNVSILDKISKILKVDLNHIPHDTTLLTLGIDSLQSAEVQSVISHQLQTILPISDIITMTIGDLFTITKDHPVIEVPEKQHIDNNFDSTSNNINQRTSSVVENWLYHLIQASPRNKAYCIQYKLDIIGHLNIQALETAWKNLVDRHDNLRTTYTHNEETVIRTISPTFHWKLKINTINQNEVSRYCKDFFDHRFNPRVFPLWDLKLLACESNTYFLLINISHLIVDGWSMGILYKELSNIYNGLISCQRILLPAPLSNYHDYIATENTFLKDKYLLSVWRRFLKVHHDLVLNKNITKKTALPEKGKQTVFSLLREEYNSLTYISDTFKLNHFQTIFSLYIYTLKNIFAIDDINLKLVIANRNETKFSQLVGYLAHGVYYSMNVPDTIQSCIQKVKAILNRRLRYSNIPFEWLCKQPSLPLREQGVPFVFNFYNFPLDANFDNINVTIDRQYEDVIDFWGDNTLFAFIAQPTGDTITIRLRYRDQIITDDKVNQFIKVFKKNLLLLNQPVSNNAPMLAVN